MHTSAGSFFGEEVMNAEDNLRVAYNFYKQSIESSTKDASGWYALLKHSAESLAKARQELMNPLIL